MKTRKNVKKIKNRYNKTIKKKGPYSQEDFQSGDGMLTTVWGPSLWHTLHTISFNMMKLYRIFTSILTPASSSE